MKDDTPILFPYSPEDLWEKIRELLRSELQRMQARKNPETNYHVEGMTQKPIYKAQEVCSMFQITRQTLHEWVKEGILKPYKIRSRVYFLWSDIEKLITQNP